MEGYSEPAPADLWEQLEKELDTVPKVIPMWRRWQAVAAVALLVVVSSLTVWFWQSPSANYLEKQSAELNVMHEPDELAPDQSLLSNLWLGSSCCPLWEKTTCKSWWGC